MAAALQYLKEHQLFEYDDLAAKTDAATEQFHTLAGDIQQTEAELSRVSDLMAAVVQYAKTRPAFDGYKAAKYNRKYLAEHEAELANYRAAKATMAELLGGEKLPKMDVLKEKRRQLAARKLQVSIHLPCLPLVRCPKTGANRVWLQLCRCLVHLESLCLEKLICLL